MLLEYLLEEVYSEWYLATVSSISMRHWVILIWDGRNEYWEFEMSSFVNLALVEENERRTYNGSSGKPLRTSCVFFLPNAGLELILKLPAFKVVKPSRVF